jgi:hypothetical protein
VTGLRARGHGPDQRSHARCRRGRRPAAAASGSTGSTTSRLSPEAFILVWTRRESVCHMAIPQTPANRSARAAIRRPR